MHYAIDTTGKKVSIKEAKEGEKYYCGCCNTEVIQRKGKVYTWCFAHKSKINCDEWYEMSEWHTNWQNEFKEEYREVTVKEDNKKHRADIKINNLIIEFQNSPLKGETFLKRSKFYSKNNFLVWVFKAHDKKISIINKRNLYGKTSFKWLNAFNFSNIDVKEYENKLKIFIEVDDDKLIGICWNANNKFKYFSGDVYTKQEFLNLVVRATNMNQSDILDKPTEPIMGFTKDNGYFFLNKYCNTHNFIFNNYRFKHVENAFQSTRNPNNIEAYTKMSPGVANNYGRYKEKTYPEWESQSTVHMYKVLHARFTQNPDLKEMLLATGDAEIINQNEYCDTDWGMCTCSEECIRNSKNRYGKVLMVLRKKLREENN